MKTELTLTQLAAIGAGAAQFAEGKPLIGNLTVQPTAMKNTTDSPERFTASDLFAPCDGCVNAETCKTIGCIAKELEQTL